MEKYSGYKNYQEYKEKQIERSNKKWGAATVRREMRNCLMKCFEDFKELKTNPKYIAYMGVRAGYEIDDIQEQKQYEDSFKFGIEINPKILEKKNNNVSNITYHNYDFTKLPKRWENKFDLIYSNSLDHSFDVKKTLKEWHRVSAKGCFIGLSLSTNTKTDEYDCNAFDEGDLSFIDKRIFKILKTEKTDDLIFNLILKVKK